MQQEALNKIMEQFHVQPVGNGYIDCICPIGNTVHFISALTDLGIRATGFTWWCYVDDAHTPCGMGGPINKYGAGWYSEIAMGQILSFNRNEKIIGFITKDWPCSDAYQHCYVPAFWLDVPTEWKNPW